MGLDNERSRVAHLLRRAGFGGSEAEVDESGALGCEGSVHRLLRAARPLTGWFAKGEKAGARQRYTGAQFAFSPAQHDGGAKTFLGQTGNWNGDDIVRIILQQPACARFVARKLFGAFVWDRPDDAT